MTDYCFTNNIYMMGETSEECENSTVIPVHKKGDKQKVENYRGISLVNACYKLYSKILNEKLKAQAGKFLVPFGMPEWIPQR